MKIPAGDLFPEDVTKPSFPCPCADFPPRGHFWRKFEGDIGGENCSGLCFFVFSLLFHTQHKLLTKPAPHRFYIYNGQGACPMGLATRGSFLTMGRAPKNGDPHWFFLFPACPPPMGFKGEELGSHLKPGRHKPSPGFCWFVLILATIRFPPTPPCPRNGRFKPHTLDFFKNLRPDRKAPPPPSGFVSRTVCGGRIFGGKPEPCRRRKRFLR